MTGNVSKSKHIVGHGLEIKGLVSSIDYLPDGANVGDIFQVGTDEQKLYLWDGETWEYIGNYRGMQGPQGEKGNKGDTGAQGDKGDPFEYDDFTDEQLEGLKGPKGDKGDKGDKGNQGAQGIQGVQGKDGYTPVKGVDYFTAADIASLGIDEKADKEQVENMYADLQFIIDDKIANIDITTDDKLSYTSTNPVQNKVITAELNNKADANYVDELGVAINDTYLLAEGKIDKEENATLLEYVPIKDDYYVRWERLNDDIRAPIGVSVAFASSQGNGVLEELSDVALVLRSYTDDEIITVITSDGEIYRTKYVVDYEDDEKTGWTEWEKVSVSQTDLNGFATQTELANAIGDIETSLDTIIAMQNSLIAPTQVTPAQETGGDTE